MSFLSAVCTFHESPYNFVVEPTIEISFPSLERPFLIKWFILDAKLLLFHRLWLVKRFLQPVSILCHDFRDIKVVRNSFGQNSVTCYSISVLVHQPVMYQHFFTINHMGALLFVYFLFDIYWHWLLLANYDYFIRQLLFWLVSLFFIFMLIEAVISVLLMMIIGWFFMMMSNLTLPLLFIIFY